jgi:hypothetical protein
MSYSERVCKTEFEEEVIRETESRGPFYDIPLRNIWQGVPTVGMVPTPFWEEPHTSVHGEELTLVSSWHFKSYASLARPKRDGRWNGD